MEFGRLDPEAETQDPDLKINSVGLYIELNSMFSLCLICYIVVIVQRGDHQNKLQYDDSTALMPLNHVRRVSETSLFHIILYDPPIAPRTQCNLYL